MPQLSLPLVEKKGGAVGPAINSCMVLNTTDNLWTTDEGSRWLKTGVVIDSPVGYPNATTFVNNYVDHGVTYDVGSAVRGSDATWDATNGFWWYYDSVNKQIVQYDENWVLTGVTIGTAARISASAYALTNDGTYLYVGEQANRQLEVFDINTRTYVTTHTLTAAGAYLGTYYLNGICWDGTNFLVRFRSDTTVGTWIQTLSSSFTAVGDAVEMDNTNLSYSYLGIAFNPVTKLLYMAGSSGTVAVRDSTGTFVDTITAVASGGCSALEWKDDVMYSIGSTSTVATTESVYYIGSPIAYGDENGLPIYTRIK